MKALILAAGLGTRLRPLTDDRPKALVEVCGRTMLERTLDTLSSEGITDFVVNVHHFAQKIVDFLAEHDNFGFNIEISDESDLLRNTGGAIRHAAPFLSGEEMFLVHNVDIMSNLDIGWLVDRASSNGALATLAVSERKTSRYLLCNDAGRLVGWTNVITGEVRTPYDNLDVTKCRKVAFSGIHVISGKIFDLLAGYPEEFSVIDLYLNICKDRYIECAEYPGLELKDLGTAAAIAQVKA